MNGALARLAEPGDRLIILSFAFVAPEEVKSHRPRVAIFDEANQLVEQFDAEIE